MPRNSSIPFKRSSNKQNTAMLIKKYFVDIKLGKKNIIIVGINKPISTAILIMIFSM